MNDIILLFDDYGMDSQNLHTSFWMAGLDFPVIVIDDNGFLPENVISVYGYYIGDYQQMEELPGKPLYFNQITVPEYWEISADNRSGKIHNLNHEMGHIYYAEPLHKRLVKTVEWLDDKGVVRSWDHYNQYGACFARTVFDAKGKRINKTYFSPDGKEIIVENYVTGAIILEDEGKRKIFRSKTEMVIYFFKEQHIENCRILFNSLSYPFFVSQKMPENGKRDILFWQEGERPDIPGNMQLILDGDATRTGQIMVQKRHAYDKLIELGADEQIVKRFGYVYPYQKEHTNTPTALICTNSDQIEKLKELVEGLPEMKFNIAALTEMSSKLMDFASYDNVQLYPGVKETVLDELFEECDYYFDVNRHNEIVNAVSEAFLFNQIIFAFSQTVHNRDVIADEHIFDLSECSKMIFMVKQCLRDDEVADLHLRLQHRAALEETEENVHSLLNEQ